MSGHGENMQPDPGSAYERKDPSAERLAEGFAQHVERWARRLQAEGATEGRRDMPGLVFHGAGAASCPPTETDFALLRHAARQTSLATSSGHVCLMLSDLASSLPGGAPPLSASPAGAGLGWGHPPLEPLRRSLLCTRIVGTPDAPGACPLILDDAGRLFLHRYFDYEVRLARRIMQAARTPPRSVSPAAHDLLNTLFPPAPGDEVDWQKIAAALALRNTLTIISGGPGTGKTTTVVNLLACLLTQEPHSRIALAAPTGKAAARMTEAIRQRAGHLPQHLRDKLPGESFTIHRLLGANPSRAEFSYHAGNPLPYDALIVDEASMLDLALATRLLEAVPASARIILLGDKDQLAAVEAGAVFAELSADPTLAGDCRRDVAQLCGYPTDQVAPPAPAQASPLHDAAVWLTRNYRFPADSGIGRLARYVNEGRAPEAMALLRADADFSIRWLDPEQGGELLDAVLGGYAGYFETVRRDPGDADAIFRAFSEFRVLCAVREGSSGSNWVNEHVTRRAPQLLAAAHEARSPWYAGRPVMVLRNDHVLKLFNGDIGIALPVAGELQVLFPDAGTGVRAVPTVRMPPHETAFATTVHKAQGSEFDAVLLSLPRQPGRIAARELLYTAVTRAKRRATLFAAAEVLPPAIQAKLERHSGLLSRLAVENLQAALEQFGLIAGDLGADVGAGS